MRPLFASFFLWTMGVSAALLLLGRAWCAEESRPRAAATLPEGVRPLDAPGLQNVFAVSTNLFSGSAPGSEEAFASLRALGIRTIITVDGAKPDLETARKYGLRYIHLPHGYDGISPQRQLQLAKAAQSVPGPVYIHCHHGKHRGPAAAAVICMANGSWDSKTAEAWLIAAGTATNYAGLYEVVREFRVLTRDQLGAVPSDFPESAQVSGLVEAMVGIDERWEHLKAIRNAGYRTPPQHPDLVPVSEAVLLWEHYREAQRLPDSAHHGSEFIERLKAAEAEARESERLLRLYAGGPNAQGRAELDRTFDVLATSCASCHRAYRDAAGNKRP